MVYRVYSSKKSPFAMEDLSMLSDLKGALGLKGLTNVKIFNRYDVEGITEKDALSVMNVFSEPQVDEHFDKLPLHDGKAFAIEYLPGQYDQRADSCAQCIECVLRIERPTVKTAKVIYLFGDINEDELKKIKGYLINPVESCEASFDLPQTLKMKTVEAPMPETLEGFISLD
ncbi:MAG: phosphoribosylformylglycinamidine synthase, partial [Oscillospiraceae bacterium]